MCNPPHMATRMWNWPTCGNLTSTEKRIMMPSSWTIIKTLITVHLNIRTPIVPSQSNDRNFWSSSVNLWHRSKRSLSEGRMPSWIPFPEFVAGSLKEQPQPNPSELPISYAVTPRNPLAAVKPSRTIWFRIEEDFHLERKRKLRPKTIKNEPNLPRSKLSGESSNYHQSLESSIGDTSINRTSSASMTTGLTWSWWGATCEIADFWMRSSIRRNEQFALLVLVLDEVSKIVHKFRHLGRNGWR